MTLDADCMLFEAGRNAAEHISTILDEQGKMAAKKAARKQYGWAPLGSGVARIGFTADEEQIAFEVAPQSSSPEYIEDDKRCVIKISTPRSGQNLEEIDQWRKIDGKQNVAEPWDRLKPFVAPVKDYDREKFRWLTMPLGKTDPVGMNHVREIEDGAREVGFFVTDIHEDNVALFGDDNEPRIIDLGSNFKYTGYTEPQRWRAHEEFLERMGCRDVFLQSRRRQFEEVIFRHPLRLDGFPNEADESFIKYTKGGNVVEMKIYGSIVPDDVATRVEVETMLDEVINVRETWRGLTPKVQGFRDGFGTMVKSSHTKHEGPTIQDVESFLEVYFDRLDAALGEVIPTDYEPNEGYDPPEYDADSEDILDSIERAFEGV